MSETGMRIPFNKPCLEGNEVNNILEAVRLGKLAGGGHFSRACERALAERIGAHRVLLTNSGSGALELAALLCDIAPGDEVIMPSFTFVSTANAFCLRGARPVFVDISPDDLNIDPTLIENAITDRTRAIVPVHYAGVCCDMEHILPLAAKHDLHVIEDAAHGCLASCKGQYLGTFGRTGCFSFHETKTFICGEGGALVINREQDVPLAEAMQEKGTDRARFFRGEVDRYTWVSLGSSFLPSELAAAFLYGQLLESDRIMAKRKLVFERYEVLLHPLVDAGYLTVNPVPDHCETNHHMYYVLVEDLEARTRLLEFLNDRGVYAVFHFVPLHLSPFAKGLGIDVKLPVTERVADRLIRLPFFNCLTLEEQEYVVDIIYSFFGKTRASECPSDGMTDPLPEKQQLGRMGNCGDCGR